MNRNPELDNNPSILAEKIGVARATITGLLDGLEKKNLIDRNSYAKDRRKLSLKLTSKGQKLLEEVLPDYWRRIGNLMKDPNKTKRILLVQMMEKVSLNISELLE